MRSLTHSFLESLAEAVSLLNRERNTNPFHPTVAVLSALILTGTAAFSSSVTLPALLLALSVILVLLTHSPFSTWVRVVAFVAVWAAVVSAPLLFLAPEAPQAFLPFDGVELKINGRGSSEMVVFVVRVTAAAAVFSAFTSMMGWRRLVEGLESLRMPREITSSLTLSMIYLPLFLREALKMLSAREARIVRKRKLRDSWEILATVVGDLLLRSHERAWRIEKAIRARSFTAFRNLLKRPSAKLKAGDLSLIAVALIIPLLGVLAGL